LCGSQLFSNPAQCKKQKRATASIIAASHHWFLCSSSASGPCHHQPELPTSRSVETETSLTKSCWVLALHCLSSI
jgi:hypothetical protein